MYFNNKCALSIATILILAFFINCDVTEPKKKDGLGQLALQVRLLKQQKSLAKINKTSSLDSVRCVILQNENQVLSTILEKQDAQFYAETKLNAGSGYKLFLYGKKGDLVAYRGEKENISITAGKTTTVRVDFIDFQVNLVSPENNIFTNDNTPAFSWSAVGDGNRYLLQVDDDENFSSPVLTAENITAESYTLSDTLPNREFYWRVQAIDSLFSEGVWSEVWHLIIDTKPPQVPLLSTPDDSSTAYKNIPSFSWNENPDVEFYHIQVDNNADFTSPGIDSMQLTSSIFQAGSAFSDGTYFWRVRAQDKATNWSNWSTPRLLTINTQSLPAPHFLAPVNSAVISYNSIGFNWDAIENAYVYHLQIARDSSFVEPMVRSDSSIKQTNYWVDFLPSTSYYCRIRTQNVGGIWGNWSEVVSFKIKAWLSDRLSLSSPRNSSALEVQPIHFGWSDLDWAASYEIAIYDSSDLKMEHPVIHKTGITNSQYTTTDSLPEGAYCWRVRGIDDEGDVGFWSGVWSFIINKSSLPAPRLYYPNGDVFIMNNSGEFSWQELNSAVAYNLQVKKGINDFSGVININKTLTGTEYNNSSYLSDGTYYWRVRAQSVAGDWGEWSEVWNFKMKGYLSKQRPDLFSPGNGSTLESGPVTFDWGSNDWAATYELAVFNSSDLHPQYQIIHQTGLTSTEYTTSENLTEGTYYWRVRGIDNEGDAGWWSEVWNLTILEKIIFKDDFNRSTLGANYQVTKGNGTASIIGYPPDGKLKLYTATNTETRVILTAPGTFTKDFKLQFYFDNGPEQRQNNTTTIYFRYFNSNNTYFYRIHEDNYQSPDRYKLFLYSVVNGSSKQLLQKNNFLMEPGVYELLCSGNKIYFGNIQDGTMVNISLTINDINKAGRIGFGVDEETTIIDDIILKRN